VAGVAIYRKTEEFSVDAKEGTEDWMSVGLYTNRDGKSKTLKPTEFFVIDSFGCSPAGDWMLGRITGGTDIALQHRINSTDYFIQPDGGSSMGVPGIAAPYPAGLVERKFILVPDIYVLPAQTYEIFLNYRNLRVSSCAKDKKIKAFVSYMVYDNTDAETATRLLSVGIAVTPENAEWVKREHGADFDHWYESLERASRAAGVP
jgi:hypothetical protein